MFTCQPGAIVVIAQPTSTIHATENGPGLLAVGTELKLKKNRYRSQFIIVQIDCISKQRFQGKFNIADLA